MRTDETISRLLSIPAEFSRRGDISFWELLNQSGYLKCPEGIRVDNIREALIQHPHRIEEWLQNAEDDRSSSGWYIKLEPEGLWVVGYYPPSEAPEPLSSFPDKASACATYIKNVIEMLRAT